MDFLNFINRKFTQKTDDTVSPYDAPEGHSDDMAALCVSAVFIPEFEGERA